MKRTRKKNALLSAVLILALGTSSYATIPVCAVGNENAVEYTKDSGRLKNVMYYGDWSIWGGQGNFYPKGIPMDQLTHLNFAFLDFDSNGELVFTDKYADRYCGITACPQGKYKHREAQSRELQCQVCRCRISF